MAMILIKEETTISDHQVLEKVEIISALIAEEEEDELTTTRR